jgi:hypothetical protein
MDVHFFRLVLSAVDGVSKRLGVAAWSSVIALGPLRAWHKKTVVCPLLFVATAPHGRPM